MTFNGSQGPRALLLLATLLLAAGALGPWASGIRVVQGPMADEPTTTPFTWWGAQGEFGWLLCGGALLLGAVALAPLPGRARALGAAVLALLLGAFAGVTLLSGADPEFIRVDVFGDVQSLQVQWGLPLVMAACIVALAAAAWEAGLTSVLRAEPR